MSKEVRKTLHASANEQADGNSDPVNMDGMVGCAYLDVTGAATGTLDVAIEEFDFETNQWFTLADFTQVAGIGKEKIVFPACFSTRLRCKWVASVPGSPGWSFAVSALTKESDE